MPELSADRPLIHPAAPVEDCSLGSYTEARAGSRLTGTALGDSSYVMQSCVIWCARIGKFSDIAASVRINAADHPTERATLHRFTYLASGYFGGEENEADSFAARRARPVAVGHDTWIGYGAPLLPGITVGDGAVVGAGAVVSRDVAPQSVAGGVPARPSRARIPAEVAESFRRLAWWDWPRAALHTALGDFRRLGAEGFLDRYEGRATNAGAA